MRLTAEQESRIQEVVGNHVSIKSLKDDVVDHLCCIVEEGIKNGLPFEEVLQKAIYDLAPDGLANLEQKTIFLLNTKKIIIMKKVIYIVGFIGSLMLTVGVNFKLLHYPGANALFIGGLLILFLLFIPLLAIDKYKVAISRAISDKLKFIFGASAAVITGLSVIFKMMHLQGADVLLMLGSLVFALGFLPFLFFTMYEKSLTQA